MADNKVTKAAAVLDWLERRGAKGARAWELRLFVWAFGRPERQAQFMDPTFRAPAGFWGDQLYGARLLATFAFKDPNGNWIRNSVDHMGRPFKTAAEYTKNVRYVHGVGYMVVNVKNFEKHRTDDTAWRVRDASDLVLSKMRKKIVEIEQEMAEYAGRYGSL